jgi:hypothetical protein
MSVGLGAGLLCLLLHRPNLAERMGRVLGLVDIPALALAEACSSAGLGEALDAVMIF